MVTNKHSTPVRLSNKLLEEEEPYRLEHEDNRMFVERKLREVRDQEMAVADALDHPSEATLPLPQELLDWMCKQDEVAHALVVQNEELKEMVRLLIIDAAKDNEPLKQIVKKLYYSPLIQT